jgi:hypothetical protein
LARFKKNETQVRQLVERFSELAQLRGELIARWPDLRAKRLLFEKAHETRLSALNETIQTLTTSLAELNAQSADRRAERDACLSSKGALATKLADIERQAKNLATFNPDLARAAEQNLKNEEVRLKNLLGQAEMEHQEKAKQKVDLYSHLVRDKELAIANFDRLAVTELRRHFGDEQLAAAFRVLSFDLLETPVGPDGITPSEAQRVLRVIETLASRVRDGVYQDESVRVVFRPERRALSELADVNALRERLEEDQETLRRWQGVLKAIAEREQLAAQLQRVGSELARLQKELLLYDQFQQARAEEPRLRRDAKNTEEAIARLDSVLQQLEQKQDAAKTERQQAQNGIRDEENAYNAVMGQFGQCVFPEFAAKAVELEAVPEDFDAATSLFLNTQERERALTSEVGTGLTLMAQLVGEEFNGADDAATISNLAAELDALPIKTEALERDWNALIQGLRGIFSGVLKELDAVRSAVTDLNRQFARVQVSNLKGIKLDVLEAGDLVSWLRRLVDLQQPGLFDSDVQFEQTVRNFRQKLEGSPLITYSQLFSLQFTVVGEDNVAHRYQDFRQIESHGTTITIKVLFNLLVLRRYLREDQCVVPFFLDEIQALDPANRAAVLSTSRKLGFLAITASPEPVTEVEALYFLQPQQGRIVLRQQHRVGVKLQASRP